MSGMYVCMLICVNSCICVCLFFEAAAQACPSEEPGLHAGDVLLRLRPRLHDGKTHIFPCVLAFHLHKNPRFYHGKRSFLKTPAKVEISENSVFVFACELGQTEF